MSIAELERPVWRASRPHPPDRRAPAAERVERRLQSVIPLVVDDGCDVRLRGLRHADAVRVSLLEWLPLTRGDLLVYEGGLHRDTSADALAALVRPPTIWTTSEALLAARLVSVAPENEQRRHDALVEYAFMQLADVHLRRLRRIAARFAPQLPVHELPRASATIALGCAAVANDDETCAAAAATHLARYATSAFVAGRRIEAAPTMI